MAVFSLMPGEDSVSSEPGLHLDSFFDADHNHAPHLSYNVQHLSGVPCGSHPVEFTLFV